MYDDLSRPPLHAAALSRGLIQPGSLWTELRVLDRVGSTNAEVAAAARGGAPEGLIVLAEHQTGGRGRLDRGWSSPPRAGLTFSVLLRPGAQIPVARWGWLPLLAGVALVDVVRRLGELDAVLKWPNDLLLGPGRGKAAGLLAEVVEGALVLGIGLNVSSRSDELPVGATSLVVEGAACTDRDPLLRGVLRALAAGYERWSAHEGDAAASAQAEAYVARCDTLGRRVSAALPGGGSIEGVAEGIDDGGRLLLGAGNTSQGTQILSAGDVVHLRPD